MDSYLYTDLGACLGPYILNIVLSYCDGKDNGMDEINTLIDIIGDDSKITELYNVGCKMASRFKNLRILRVTVLDDDGDIPYLQGIPLHKLDYMWFSGKNIDSLRCIPLRELRLGCFTGDIHLSESICP